MFPLLNNRNLHHVERKILSYLGHMDLVWAAFVCKRWYQAIEKKEGRNIVLWAVINGCEHLVEFILGDDSLNVNEYAIDWTGTALMYAATNGQERIVRLLLERKDILVNAMN